MSAFDNPFDPETKLHRGGCSCGRHASQAAHDAAMKDEEARVSRVVESAVMRGLFPDDQVRRNFLRAVGAGTAMAAISTLFPMGAAKALERSAPPLDSVVTAVAATLAVVIGGRFLLRHLLRVVARAKSVEVFTASALLVVVGNA
ncbi:MAG: twin-arginine translocation signal domain-containing protein, partial [Gammaproteobacteria bacterium]